MTARLTETLDRLAEEAGVKEITPEIRKLAWLVEHTALIAFWKAAARQAEYQQEVMTRFLKKDNT
jgi:hypothetical protein